MKKCFKWHFSSSRTTTVETYFWNARINVQVMARTSSKYDHFDLYLTPVTLTFNLPKTVSNGTSTPRGKQLYKFILKSMHEVMFRTSSIHEYDHFDLYLTPVTLTFYLPKMFQRTPLLLKGNNCAKLFWNPCINIQVVVRTNPDGCRDIHRTKIVTYPQAGSTKTAFIFDQNKNGTEKVRWNEHWLVGWLLWV